jgi:hypothetical protein
LVVQRVGTIRRVLASGVDDLDDPVVTPLCVRIPPVVALSEVGRRVPEPVAQRDHGLTHPAETVLAEDVPDARVLTEHHPRPGEGGVCGEIEVVVASAAASTAEELGRGWIGGAWCGTVLESR